MEVFVAVVRGGVFGGFFLLLLFFFCAVYLKLNLDCGSGLDEGCVFTGD